MKDEEIISRLGAVARERDGEPLPEIGVGSAFAEKIAAEILKRRPPAVVVRGPAQWFQGRAFKRMAPLAGGFAAAAAVVFYLSATAIAPLPSYELVSSGGDSVERGSAVAPSEHLRLHADDHVVLLLRPGTKVDGDVAAYFFLRRGGAVERWGVVPRISEEGAVLVDTVAPELRAATEVIVVVRRGALDEVAATKAARTGQAGNGMRLFRVEVEK